MGSVFVAKATKLFDFHTVRMIFFLLGGVVIALLAVVASQGYF